MAETKDTMRIWDAVSKTNPANTKHVSQRGGFTAINANSQIMEATRQFGPIGIGWGYVNATPIFEAGMVIVPVTLWHGDRSNTFGPVYGSEEVAPKGRLDTDAPKKAATDGLTKCLSQLGFNADVFLGLYDDQKYVAAVTAEFSPKVETPKLISDEQRDELAVLIDSFGHNIAEICQGMSVKSLKNIRAESFEKAKAFITKFEPKKEVA